MPHPRTFLLSVAAVLVGTVAAGAVAEVALRVFWPQRSAVTLGMFRGDPIAGYSLQPGYRNEIRVPEYTTAIRIDADGYRVPEQGADDDAEVRVLAIGDSFTFGVGVNAEDAWPEVLERLLQAGDGPQACVRNGGVGGYGALRSAKHLSSRQAAWEPHVVVHALYVGNDLEDSDPAEYLRVPRIRNGRMVVAAERGALIRARFWLRIHSHLYAFLRERLYDLYQRTPLAERSRYLDPVALSTWPERIETVTWPAAQDAVREIAAWARGRGTRYLVVLVPMKYQVNDEAWRVYQRRWDLPEEAFARDRAQHVIGEFLAGEGIAFVDLLSGLRGAEREEPGSVYFAVDAHWTAEGHRLAAELVQRELRDRGWIASRAPGLSDPGMPVASVPGGRQPSDEPWNDTQPQ